MSLSPKTAIISAADAGYVRPLRGLIQSILDCRPSDQSHQMDICVLDLGMEPAQLDQLRPLVAQIVPGRWTFEFPGRDKTPRWLQAMHARPLLREFLPGYQRYIWFDADTWLADWRTIELLTDHLIEGIAVVPELHPSYVYLYGPSDLKTFNYARALESFGEPAARLLYHSPIINSGVFAMPHDSPIWDLWTREAQSGFRRSPNKWTEQNALSLAIFRGNTPVRFLPAYCNWICGHALPFFDPARKCLCEPARPFDKLSVVHLTSVHPAGQTLFTTRGDTIQLPLDYPGFKHALNP